MSETERCRVGRENKTVWNRGEERVAGQKGSQERAVGQEKPGESSRTREARRESEGGCAKVEGNRHYKPLHSVDLSPDSGNTKTTITQCKCE